jgi:hypothetical protein
MNKAIRRGKRRGRVLDREYLFKSEIAPALIDRVSRFPWTASMGLSAQSYNKKMN